MSWDFFIDAEEKINYTFNLKKIDIYLLFNITNLH